MVVSANISTKNTSSVLKFFAKVCSKPAVQKRIGVEKNPNSFRGYSFLRSLNLDTISPLKILVPETLNVPMYVHDYSISQSSEAKNKQKN